jgi:UDP-glucose 4-epimerase
VKVLVTGGAGYIGSVVAGELVQAGHEVLVLDNLYQGHRDAVPAEATFVEGDLADNSTVLRLFAEHGPVDGVMHFASYTLVGESMTEPAKYLRDNVVAGINLMDAAARAGTQRFILSSTANLFDAPARVPIGADELIVPGSPYGESKHTLERALVWYERLFGMRHASLRYFNAAGAAPGRGEDHAPEYHLIPLVLSVALGQRDKIVIFGNDYPTPDGTCVRDYIHVVDLAQAHILALDALHDLGSRRYNLGNGSGFSNLEVVEAARRVTGHAIPHELGPRRPGDPAVLIASSETIRAELGWAPRFTTIDAIIETAWAWHRSHPGGYAA